MPGAILYVKHPVSGELIPVLADADGKLVISDADPFSVVQDTPENLKHVPHGYYAASPSYLPYAVDSAGKLQMAIASLAKLDDIDDVNVPAPDDGDFLYWDDAAGKWQSIAHATNYGLHTKVVRKTANEIVNNSNTFQADDELFLPVAANEIWVLTAYIRFHSTAVADLYIGFKAPAGAAGEFTGLYNGAAGQTAFGYGLSVGARGIDELVVINCIGIIGATAGNIALWWCQNTAEATDTTVYTNSCLVATKIA